MVKRYRPQSYHDPVYKGTSIGRNPIMTTMNKSKRRSYKKYRGQGKRR